MTGKSCFIFTFLSLMSLAFSEVAAQENPPIPVKVEVRNAMSLNFGSFTVGNSGGSVTVTYDKRILQTGDIYLLDFGANRTPALFDVTANPGTILQIQAPTNVELTGSNGGTIYLDINSFSTGQTFITTAVPPQVNEVFVGGTLRIDNSSAAPAGSYNGTFTLTFIHQ